MSNGRRKGCGRQACSRRSARPWRMATRHASSDSARSAPGTVRPGPRATRRTGETLSVAASTVPVFKAGKTLKRCRGQRRGMNGGRMLARWTRGADEGLDIECARLRHDDRRGLWNLPTPLRIAENQWVALAAIRFAHVTRPSLQKPDCGHENPTFRRQPGRHRRDSRAEVVRLDRDPRRQARPRYGFQPIAIR